MKQLSQILLFALAFTATSCGQQQSDELDPGTAANGSSSSESLYVASGGCYGGGVTLSAGSGTIAAFDPATGAFRRVVVDYASYSPGDTPVAIADYDATHILVAVENTSGRRVDLVSKFGQSVSTYLSNSTALNGVLRTSKFLDDGSLLISKSTAIEKFTPAKGRVLQGANAFVQAPASTCATSATLLSSLDTLSNGKILLSHAAATPNNKLILISKSGYATTADCLNTQAAPTTTAMPTAVLTHSSGKVLVSWGSTTAASNFVYSYPVNATTNAFGTPVAAFSDNGVLVNGPTAMTEDAFNGDVYVANGLSTMNTIERFSFDSTAGTLTSKSVRFGPNIYTRCVSAMKAIRE